MRGRQNKKSYTKKSLGCKRANCWALGGQLCPEMQAVTKMADLTKFRQTDVGQSDDFYANYLTRDGVNMLANLAIFMQITS